MQPAPVAKLAAEEGGPVGPVEVERGAARLPSGCDYPCVSEPTKHHFVPQFLLRGFSDERGRLSVHRLDGPQAYVSNVRNLAHRNHGHTLFWPHRPPNRGLLERRMSDLEGETKTVLDRLSNATETFMQPEDRLALSWFISLQWHRHRYTLDYAREKVLRGEAPAIDPVEQRVRQSIGLTDLLVMLDAWAARDDPSARPKEKWDNVVSLLQGFHWRLLRYRRPVLVVSDATVGLSGVATGETADAPSAWTLHGFGVGFGNCRRISIPLTPQLGLLLDRDEPPRHIPAVRFNRLTVATSREFVATPPDFHDREPVLARSMSEDLWTQRHLYRVFAAHEQGLQPEGRSR